MALRHARKMWKFVLFKRREKRLKEIEPSLDSIEIEPSASDKISQESEFPHSLTSEEDAEVKKQEEIKNKIGFKLVPI